MTNCRIVVAKDDGVLILSDHNGSRNIEVLDNGVEVDTDKLHEAMDKVKEALS